MNKSWIYIILHYSFYFNIFLGTLMNVMEKSKYSFPPNMGWIIMLGILTILHKEKINR